MITLHLVLHRPEKDSISRDPNWGPYLSTLPREFSSHPMTWAVRNHFGLETALEKDLLSLLPSAVMSALGERVCRFAADWKAICSYVPSCTLLTRIYPLVVNTRCVYYQLDPSSLAPENLTLCPVLDFANHRPHDTHIIPVSPSSIFPPTPGSSSKGRHGLGGDYTFMASSETPVHQDEELFLRYGGHSNRMLFVEYGFVNLWNEGECTGGQFDGEVDVQDMMEELFVVKGATGGTLKDALEEEGYWGDWTMHSQPTPAHPSYRLVSALRLLHAAADDATEDVLDRALEQWRAVLWGQVEQISEENEKAWRNTLPLMCQRIARKARAEIQSMQRHGLQPNGLEDPAWKGWMLKNIDMLWREEYEVAEAVGESVRVGVDF
ncbi:uncharacterized protein PHACADRAFT_94457 [Phanerochaete carnosa HHB-10118-sp]|uniref:SET domain-containing protein n=1 Tax=Phanerochaete carnosa (strain HHB-10118-sp) TaxID=650164 RepID=K5W8C9_PHACS|nr:uncharacterized protein PHACADRAFT_94457 [Phanerochaete carnosa HHB-10118-sp]EKM55430.1 hypothetical protein PHACADRAFT_94457 [Phanerochaete carnosa HHB-10118-sp]